MERRALSVLGRFVLYHLRLVFKLRDKALNRLCVRLLDVYNRLAILHGFQFQSEPIFSLKSGTFIDDRDTRLWVADYAGRVVRIFRDPLLDAYDTFFL